MRAPNDRDDELEWDCNRWDEEDVELAIKDLDDKKKGEIHHIWLGFNHFDVFPESLLLLRNVRGISIPNTGIKTIPRSIGNLVNLEYLYLHDNNLTTLPSSMLKLTNLKVLHLRANNSLTENIRMYCSSKSTTQKLLFNIAVEEWKMHARRAAVTWILVARYRGLCSKDVARMIGKMVYGTHREEIWEEAAEAVAAVVRPTKRIKK